MPTPASMAGCTKLFGLVAPARPASFAAALPAAAAFLLVVAAFVLAVLAFLAVVAALVAAFFAGDVDLAVVGNLTV